MFQNYLHRRYHHVGASALRFVAFAGLVSCCVFAKEVIAAEKVTQDVPMVKQVEQAIDKRKQGLVYDSIAMLLDLQQRQPANVRINLELAISYLKVQKHDKAQAQVNSVLERAPAMKNNKRIQKLQEMINVAKQKAQDSKHQFKGELTFYRGYDELTAKIPYFEITEFEDYYIVERKEDSFKVKDHYIAGRANVEYRYTPTSSFNLFGLPTYSFWNNRITKFQKHSLGDTNAYFGFDSFDSSYFLMQPKRWAFNAKVKWKWHTYHNERSVTEKTADINGSVLFYGARIKLGIHRSSSALNQQYAEQLFGDSFTLVSRKSSIISPYLKLSYRFNPSLLWTIGSRKRSIHASVAALEGTVMNYNTTLKYNINDDLDLHLSYSYDDLDYDVVDLDIGLHSGEVKKSAVLGLGYQLTEDWQIGINALHMDREQNDDYGQDHWTRFEGFVRYRF